MKFIISLLLIVNVNAMYSQNTDTLFKRIEWLRGNYPDEKWMQISKNTLDDILSLNLDTKIYSDPLDTLLSENSRYTHIFVKVYTLSVVEYNLKQPKKNKALEANLYGYDCLINYYQFLTKIKKDFKSGAIEFYINLKETNQLKSYLKKKTKYLKKEKLS
jgi:hypothetical protein